MRTLYRRAAFLLLTIALLCYLAGFRIPRSPSLPPGLYRISRQPPQSQSPPIVVVCLPEPVSLWARHRGYVARNPISFAPVCPDRGAPVAKLAVARAGDHVVVLSGSVQVNGSPLPNSEPLALDSSGRPMPIALSPGVLPQGALWLHSPHHPRSLDSRVYGPVSQDKIVGYLTPIFTAESP